MTSADNESEIRLALQRADRLRRDERCHDAEQQCLRLLGECKAEYGWNHLLTLEVAYSLSVILRDQERPEEAEKTISEVLVTLKDMLGERDEKILNAMCVKANIVLGQGRLDEADELYTKIFVDAEELLGENHSLRHFAANALGIAFEKWQDYNNAEMWFLRAKEICERCFGPNHRSTRLKIHNLSRVYVALGDQQSLNKATEIYFEALTGFKKFGEEDSKYPEIFSDLIGVYKARNMPDEAEKTYQRALGQYKRDSRERRDKSTVQAIYELAELLKEAKEYEKAEFLYKRAIADYKEFLGPENNMRALQAGSSLGECYAAQDKWDSAIETYRHVLPEMEKAHDIDRMSLTLACFNLGTAYSKVAVDDEPHTSRRLRTAESLLKRALESYEETYGEDHRLTIESLFNIGLVSYLLRKHVEAREYLTRAHAARVRTLGEEHELTIRYLSLLATAYSGQASGDHAQTGRGDFTKGLELHFRLLSLQEKVLGRHDEATLQSLHNLACIFIDMNNKEEAEKYAKQVLSRSEENNENENTGSEKASRMLDYLNGDASAKLEEIV